jgi:hypothetical protein
MADQEKPKIEQLRFKSETNAPKTSKDLEESIRNLKIHKKSNKRSVPILSVKKLNNHTSSVQNKRKIASKKSLAKSATKNVTIKIEKADESTNMYSASTNRALDDNSNDTLTLVDHNAFINISDPSLVSNNQSNRIERILFESVKWFKRSSDFETQFINESDFNMDLSKVKATAECVLVVLNNACLKSQISVARDTRLSDRHERRAKK